MSNIKNIGNISNMSNITDWVKDELYPSLFERIDQALPEHNFKRYPGGWMSKTYLDGRPHKSRADKTVVSKKTPGRIKEWGGDNLSLADYVMRRDRVEFIQAVRTLATVAGIQLPGGSSFDPEIYRRDKDRATLLEEADSYFTYCLENAKGGAEEVRSYLGSRGYSPEDIKLMGLGYIPSQDQLYKYLLGKGYSQALIDEVLPLNKGIGSTHRLTIPYRSGGFIKGVKFRTIGDITPKYLNSSGLDRSGGFFNLSALKGYKDLVIVEGELDSLHATAKGIENVVALGGSNVTEDQVRDAKQRGARSFTICLDTEPGKEEETAKRISTAIGVILQGDGRPYITTLPDLGGGKTDPDRLLKERGPDELREAISQAIPYYEYWLQRILFKYDKIAEPKEGVLTPKELDRLREEITETSTRIAEPMDRDQYLKLFSTIGLFKELGITEESIKATVEELRYEKDKELRDKAYTRILSEATGLPTEEGIKRIEAGLQEIRIGRGKDLLPPPQSYESLLQAIAETPPAHRTGYSSLDKFIGFTPGAISLVAGRPSHGKTTLLFNLLLEMSNTYPQEKFYFFTYEEPVKNLSIKLLNRLTATSLGGYFGEYTTLARPTNYEYLKAYIKEGRTDIQEIEEGKRRFKDLVDSNRIKVIDQNYSVEELQSLIAYLNQKEKIGAVFIDYIQRMRTERRTQDKRTEIAHISDQVLQIAKESGLPIILGAQLNRASMGGGSKRPTLEGLKEAGNLEEDANTVLSVYNESRERDEDQEGETYTKVREVELEIKALKNREGEVNEKAILLFDKWTGVITDKPILNTAKKVEF